MCRATEEGLSLTESTDGDDGTGNESIKEESHGSAEADDSVHSEQSKPRWSIMETASSGDSGNVGRSMTIPNADAVRSTEGLERIDESLVRALNEVVYERNVPADRVRWRGAYL